MNISPHYNTLIHYNTPCSSILILLGWMASSRNMQFQSSKSKRVTLKRKDQLRLMTIDNDCF